jgi:outer membrane protein OmpA-like peptidoglycan-associated protein
MRRALPLAICLSHLIVLGCAKSQTVAECAPERWEGECQLASITKVEDKEFPIPHVVMEAVYRPVENPRFPTYTPGALAERTLVKSEYELPLYDYLEAHPRVACAAQPPAGGACVAPKVLIALAPFNPQAASSVAAAPPITGCAQIESTSAQDSVRENQGGKTTVGQRIAFAESSSELPPDANQVTGQVAELLRAQPSIECLGIVGQIASGESPALAEQRAKAVRDLLGAHGVALTRLLTIGATAKVFGEGSRPAEADPADRRVSFSVLLERAPAPPRAP